MIYSLRHGGFSVKEAGFKAYRLSQLIDCGFLVPEGLVIPVQADAEVPLNLEERLPSNSGWMVRSSSLEEDLSNSSNAGRFRSVYIENSTALKDAIDAVLQSGKKDQMAVLVQSFIHADFSGVAFSQDPLTGKDSPVIELAEGKGEQVVGGEVQPYTFQNGEWHCAKPKGLSEVVFERFLQEFKRINNLFPFKIDVEFCIKGDALYWLQVRPITSVKEIVGEWFLLDQCTEPVPLLLQQLDPSGLFHSDHWNTRFVNDYPYIRLKHGGNQDFTPVDINQEWEKLKEQFEPIFDCYLHKTLNDYSLDELWNELRKRIAYFREYCGQYMDRNWLKTRGMAAKAIKGFIKKTMGPDCHLDAGLSVLSTGITTISFKKHQLLNALIQENRDHRNRDKLFNQFLKQYGYESLHPVLCHLPTLAEDSEALVRLIEKHAQHDPVQELQKRDDWQSYAHSIESNLSKEDREAFRFQLKVYRDSLLRTENDDVLMQKGSAAVRYVLLEIGKRLSDAEQIHQVDEIFHLSLHELESLSMGKRIQLPNLEGRIKRFQKARSSRPVVALNSSSTTEGEEFLKGQPVSWGRIEGSVFVIENPLERKIYSQIPKQSIILAPILSPNLVYSLVSVSGIITETGGFLSHGAIFAREKGIPAIVGVEGALTRLRSGDRVCLNADEGIVEIIR